MTRWSGSRAPGSTSTAPAAGGGSAPSRRRPGSTCARPATAGVRAGPRGRPAGSPPRSRAPRRTSSPSSRSWTTSTTSTRRCGSSSTASAPAHRSPSRSPTPWTSPWWSTPATAPSRLAAPTPRWRTPPDPTPGGWIRRCRVRPVEDVISVKTNEHIHTARAARGLTARPSSAERLSMRIGLIGLGRIGAFHAGTLVGIPAIESLVVTDLVPERTKQVVDRHRSDGVEGADSLAALLASGVDGVIIAAGTDAHPELVLACVEAGLPTLCEKPVAQTGAAGAELLRRLEGSTVPVQMGFQRRYDAAIAAARAAVVGGELGWITTVRSTTLDPEPPSPEYVAVSGGMFRDCGVHDFDAIRWVTGQEAVEVYATGSNRGADFFRRYDDVDTSAAIVTFADGALGIVSNTRYNARGYDVRLEVHGSQDSVAAGIDDGWPIRATEPGVTFPAGPPHRFFMDRFQPAFRAEFQTFLEVVAGDRPSPCTVADGLEADWIAEACARSVKEHRPVRIDEVRIT